MKKEKIPGLFQSELVRFVLMGIVFLLLLGVARNLFEFSVALNEQDSSIPLQGASLPSQSPLAQLSQSHLLGGGEVTMATDTNLGLVLEGILFSSVLIATPGQAAQPYHVGDRVPGGGIVDKILSDAVVIDQNGRLIQLSLQRRSLQFAPPSSQSLFH